MSRTIVALATPPGIGGIAVIRISGTKAFEITQMCISSKKSINQMLSHSIIYCNFQTNEQVIDTVLVSKFQSPNSYTGLDTIEISCHGGVIIADMIIKALVVAGAEYAEPGEFTKLAFLNGKLDLLQVEAVADMIHSVSTAGVATSARQLIGEFTLRLSAFREQLLRIAALLELELDFSEEGLELIDRKVIEEKINSSIQYCQELSDSYTASNILRSGYFVGIIGFPNSGKSTLFNTLLNRNRAIVSEIAGTTRDYLEETLYINGLPIRLIDTAGIRDSQDIIEIEGIKLVDSVIEQSNLILVLNDASEGLDNSNQLFIKLNEKYPQTQKLIIQNKTDLIGIIENNDIIFISAKNKTGIDKLKAFLENEIKQSTERVSDVLINQRHYNKLQDVLQNLIQAKESLLNQMENEIISIDIRYATKLIGEITGEAWNEEVLDLIFSSFCIGK
jgi:tRNA modification GTPase